MAKGKKEEPVTGRVEGLSIVMVASPFEGMNGTILDMRGPWTEGLIDRWCELSPDELDQPVGIAIWTGAAIVTDEWASRHRIQILWEGAWRRLRDDEFEALKNDDRPLAMTRFPSAAELLPLPVT
jgi:hypothetical protein